MAGQIIRPTLARMENGAGIQSRRARQRALAIGVDTAGGGRRRSPGRAQGAAANGGCGDRGRDGPGAPRARSRPLLRSREAGRAARADQPKRRQPGRLRRRARAPPGAQPRAGARSAGDRPYRDHPRRLRRPRPLGGGQAPGRARPAPVQPRPHARAVDPPRATRRRAHGRRHRDQGARRVARSRPTAGWRATGSRRCAAGSSESSAIAA